MNLCGHCGNINGSLSDRGSEEQYEETMQFLSGSDVLNWQYHFFATHNAKQYEGKFTKCVSDSCIKATVYAL